KFNLEEALQLLPIHSSQQAAVCGFTGTVAYYHYGCDGLNDAGWGCGYRACQTQLHWLLSNSKLQHPDPEVPAIPAMQSALVAMGDKPPSFTGSREWIGCLEAAYLADKFANRRCRILHQSSQSSEVNVDVKSLKKHFEDVGCPVMMGGHTDASAKTVLAVSGSDTDLLLLDPHYGRVVNSPPLSLSGLVHEGWLSWRSVDSLTETAFYNMCLPLTD
ncbi:hypothetical protein BOX15_Mlig009352g2, partial [Macrostomum lignano]